MDEFTNIVNTSSGDSFGSIPNGGVGAMTAGGSAPPVLGGMQGPSSLGVYGGMNQLPPYGGGAGPYGMDPCGGMNPLTGTMMPPYRGGAGPYGMDPFADPHRMVPYGRRASPYGGWESPMMTRSAKPSAKPTKPAAPKKPLLSAATGQPANVKLLAKSLDKFYKLHLPGVYKHVERIAMDHCNDIGALNKILWAQYGADLTKLPPDPRQASPAEQLKDKLERFYENFAPHPKGGRSSIDKLVQAFVGKEHLLDQELKAKYGYCLKDLNNMPPRIAPENITPNSSRDSKTGMATQAQSVHVRFKEDTKVDAKVTQGAGSSLTPTFTFNKNDTQSSTIMVEKPDNTSKEIFQAAQRSILKSSQAISTAAKWDKSRRSHDIVLSNSDTTVTRYNDDAWGGVLGSQLLTEGTHSFTYFMNKCEGEYVYVGVAYDNVDLCHPYSSIVLRAKNGSSNQLRSESDHFFPGNQHGRFAGYRTGDCIRIEVDMAAKLVTFFKNDVRLCQASGIKAPVRPFICIGAPNVVITIQSPTVGDSSPTGKQITTASEQPAETVLNYGAFTRGYPQPAKKETRVGGYTAYTKHYPFPANMDYDPYSSNTTIPDGCATGTVSVPTNRSSTGNRPNQPIISEQLPQPGEMVVIKGLCACCSHDVKSNQPRFLDGQTYYHHDCWVTLLAEVEMIKERMKEKVRKQLIANAVQRGVLGEIENPTPKFNYTKGIVNRINGLGGELSEADEEEEAIELVCERPSLLRPALIKPQPGLQGQWQL